MFIVLFIILSLTVSLVYLNIVYNNKVNNHTRFIEDLFEKLQFYNIRNSKRVENIEELVSNINNNKDVPYTGKDLPYDELVYLTDVQLGLDYDINDLNEAIKSVERGENNPITGDNIDIMKKQLRYMKSYNSALKERIRNISSARSYSKDIVRAYSYKD